MGSLFVEGLGIVIECVILYIGCECEYICVNTMKKLELECNKWLFCNLRCVYM